MKSRVGPVPQFGFSGEHRAKRDERPSHGREHHDGGISKRALRVPDRGTWWATS